MNDWFTIDKIDAKTYVISEYHHPEETHCYLLNGNERSLLIDTGVGISNIYIEVLHTPGHSPGHCCFYEQDRGWLYSGDLIYQGCFLFRWFVKLQMLSNLCCGRVSCNRVMAYLILGSFRYIFKLTNWANLLLF